NAILGDFRALDTLTEGIVLIIAGLGIFTLLNYRDRRGQYERE
ncbi:hydrogen gas-evolving membrane-bound hydrogenase subunit E, partial [Staphylococcus felis]